MNTTAISALKPIDDSSRILTIDVVRGVALLGIFAMNIMTFSMPFSAYFNPTTYPAIPFEGANKWMYYITHTLFDMKMMTLFSMLFGVGVMVYAEKLKRGAELAEVRWLWFKRMFILLGIGMLHAYFLWEGDILVGYAVCGIVFLWWMRRLPVWAMLLIAIPMTIIPQITWMFNGFSYQWFVTGSPPEWMGMPEDQIELQREAMQKMMNPTAEQIVEMETTMRGGWFGIFKHRAFMSFQMQAFMIPMFLLWRGTAMMLIGAALYKCRVITGERTTLFYALFTLINYAIGFTLVIMGIQYNTSVGFDPAKIVIVGSHFNGIGSIPMAMGHMGLVILITRALPVSLVVRSLASVGRMALTNYLAHTVIGSLIFYGYGLGLYGTMDRVELGMVVVGVWIAQLIWSPVWLSRFRFGPVEWAWRTLTYGKAQPMKKAA